MVNPYCELKKTISLSPFGVQLEKQLKDIPNARGRGLLKIRWISYIYNMHLEEC
jgi:hypothetical protein